MAKSVNKHTIIGNLVADPESRQLQSGTTVTNFRVATGESWKDKQTGEWQERTEFHQCSAFGRLAESIAEHATKGRKVWLEGKSRTRKWQGNDGVDRYTTEIHLDDFMLLGPKPQRDSEGAPPSQYQQPAQAQPQQHAPAPQSAPPNADPGYEEIPTTPRPGFPETDIEF